MAESNQHEGVVGVQRDVGRQATLWSCDEGTERLSAKDIGEAVQKWYDDLYPDQVMPETVTVHGFAPIELPPVERLAEWAAEYMVERLDEEYGDPDGCTKPSRSIMAAARVFAESLREEYMPWMCEPIEKHEVRVADYVTPPLTPNG